MPELSKRTETFTDSVIRRMTRISNQYGAVNLSQGFPDFEPPRELLDRLAEVSNEDFHQYSITWGAQNFREALAEKQSRLMGRRIDPNAEIVVTCGSTEAMMAAMMTVANPGDKVIVFSPFYENYGADTILSGAEPIYVPLYPPEFNFDPNELEAAFRQKPKALILCNPSNPCGKVFNYDELKSTLSMLRTNTPISLHCPICGRGRSPVPRFQKPIPLRDGVWDISSLRRKLSTLQKRFTTF